ASSEQGEPAARRHPLPAPAPPAGTRWTGRVDHHVSQLTGEAVGATDRRAAGDDETADAGAEPDEDHLVDPTTRADAPLRDAGSGVVVVDRDVAATTADARRQLGAQVETAGRGQVSRGEEHP